MTTYTLIVAMVTGAGIASNPYQTHTYVEKGHRTLEVCAEAAKPYVALGKFNRRGSGYNTPKINAVNWDCIEVKQ